MPSSDSLHATCASGLEGVLAEELRAIGLADVRRAGAGASFSGGLEAGYRACLHSRVANRVLMPLHAGPAATPEALYALVREVDWSEHLAVDGTLAVDFLSANSGITHTQYGALKVKDAVVDQFRDATGRRPNVERATPDLRINCYVFRDKARLAIDLSGASLHRRGYREEIGPAPLKENIAAGLLLAAGWRERADEGEPFFDPQCGSGTLLVEAAMIAARRAPGLGRRYWGFENWRGHDSELWQRLEIEARAEVRALSAPISGADVDPDAVRITREAIASAGYAGEVLVERRALASITMPVGASGATGLVLTNPPWGERLDADPAFYQELGLALARGFAGWRCGLFVSNSAPLAAARLPLGSVLEVRNGGIDCRLVIGDVPAAARAGIAGRVRGATARSSDTPLDSKPDEEPHSDNARRHARRDDGLVIDSTPFANRVAKNLRGSKGWRRQREVRAFRAYDSDLPEFAVAIDVYDCGDDGTERHVVLQEYQAPRTVNAAIAAARLDAVVEAVPDVLDVDPARVHLRTRSRQRGGVQYERRVSAGPRDTLAERRSVAFNATLIERGRRFGLNFTDYLDVGLFLDHRPVRRHIGEIAAGKRFLNLFAYTGAATVEAVAGGAGASVSIDLSNRYVAWARANLAANGADPVAHRVDRADVTTWLERAGDEVFDLILLDPPTHSNSTSLERDWDVQTDHVGTIDACAQRLAPGGLLVFSNNYRRFRLDADLERRYAVEDRSAWSIDPDFRRNARIHRCWFIRRRET